MAKKRRSITQKAPASLTWLSSPKGSMSGSIWMRIWSQPSFLKRIVLSFPERSDILRTMRIDNKIGGVVFRVVKTDKGPAYLNPEEEVIEVSLKSDNDSNSTNVYVLSKEAAKELSHQLLGHLI